MEPHWASCTDNLLGSTTFYVDGEAEEGPNCMWGDPERGKEAVSRDEVMCLCGVWGGEAACVNAQPSCKPVCCMLR